MTREKIVKICGKDVKMIYCAASETGYEKLTNNSIDVFSPTFGKDEEGNDIITERAKALMTDYIYLAIASIVAAYEKAKQTVPINSEELLYEATPSELQALITAVVELRFAWYGLPDMLKKSIEEENKGTEDNKKNE